ncbi:MAG: choice-of-anchor D domain-containing protein [Ignavibacteriales bacterium]|nr:MAG: choice-of-anchor D domain-containing protein [Ignavibacteriales bacterium]
MGSYPYGTVAGTWRDYRPAAAFPFSGDVAHTIKWQLATGATTFELQYALPTGAEIRITDNFGGVLFNSGFLTGSGTYSIPPAFVSSGIGVVTMRYTNIAPAVVGPVFSVAPASLTFGTVNLGNNATLPVTVTNTGNADLNITGIVSSDAQFTFAAGTFPVVIAAGLNQVFNVTFTPTANGPQNGTLTFTHDAPGSPTVYNVGGVGYTPAPIFGVSPASLNFGPVNIGGNAVLPLTVSNTGDAQLTLTNIVSSDGQYTFAPNAFPVNIAAGGNAVFNVTFTPTAAGTQNATLTFTHNAAGSPNVYSLTGSGFTTAPVFGLSAASLSFGNVSVGGTSTLPVTVNNTGNAQLTISNIVSSNGVFTFAPGTFPVNIAAGGSQLFNVTFTPTAAGLVSGDLTFTHNAAGSPSVLPLSGTGQTQGGLLRFVNASQNLLDGTENNPDAVVLEGYTGQPMKALQFDIVVGKSNGRLILRSVSRGAAITAPEFNFSYEIYPGPTLPDGSSRDRVKIVIVGNGTNSIQPAFGTQEIAKFAFDIVDITGPSATTTNGLENVLGATATPVINANISTGADEVINIGNGTSGGLYGDVNLDDQVNILDILLMIDHILGRTTLTGLAFTQGDLAPWTVGQPLPVPDGVINVLDLSVLQNIVLTNTYPSGTPVYKVAGSPFDISINSFEKLTPGMNAKLTFYLTNNGMTVRIESIKKVKGVQIELNGMGSLIPSGTEMTSVFDQALYYQLNDFLRTLTYDPEALTIDAGEYMLAKLPFALNDPEAIIIEKIIVADENNGQMDKVEVEIRYEEPPTGLPLDYVLEQNFPNPFNPNTTVQFQVRRTDL